MEYPINIAEIISRYIQLQPTGSRLKGNCPFCKTKPATFSVDPQNGLFYCFSCKCGGDAYTFIKLAEGVEFVDAARLLISWMPMRTRIKMRVNLWWKRLLRMMKMGG